MGPALKSGGMERGVSSAAARTVAVVGEHTFEEIPDGMQESY